jgi:nucleoside-diphosphate-sugar epimerase
MLGTSHFFSHAKARDHFDYAPKISTDEGLERYWRTN